MRFGRGVDNRRYKAAGFNYQHTSREAVLKLGEYLRLHPVLRGRAGALPLRARGGGLPALEPAREEHARHVGLCAEPRPARRAPAAAQTFADEAMDPTRARPRRAAEAERSRPQSAAELPTRAGRGGARPRAAPAARPEHYDDLAAEEVIALLGSLEHGDLQMLREYERAHANRTRVLSAIDSVLARAGSARLSGPIQRNRRCQQSSVAAPEGTLKAYSHHEAPVVHPRGRPPPGPGRRRRSPRSRTTARAMT